jgi:hypothetical protein
MLKEAASFSLNSKLFKEAALLYGKLLKQLPENVECTAGLALATSEFDLQRSEEWLLDQPEDLVTKQLMDEIENSFTVAKLEKKDLNARTSEQ